MCWKTRARQGKAFARSHRAQGSTAIHLSDALQEVAGLEVRLGMPEWVRRASR